ncbi:MAG: Bax inhibitor-1/YccA family protein [Halobacteriovoraceae bacterium]|nr:Bax inhibitor-1/YccA family protein [Halobacteriovoraceae bacterium]MBT5093638.1 Bax inhibitor-1/YccA family protein [Halobacteriovoraceae bacterium]
MEYNQQPQNTYGGQARTAEATGVFMAKVYRWMTLGLALTAFVAYMISLDKALVETIYLNRVLYWGLIIAEFGLVIYLSARIQKMSAMTAITAFLVYSALSGVTFSVLSLIYTGASIQNTFITAATSFAGLSFFGYVTKRDLGPLGTFCHMGLYGIIGIAILSIFFPSMMGGTMGLVYSGAGVLIFAGLTAYDTQKIKEMAHAYPQGTEGEQKVVIMGALKLYLDFINLFLFLLRFMGRGRD